MCVLLPGLHVVAVARQAVNIQAARSHHEWTMRFFKTWTNSVYASDCQCPCLVRVYCKSKTCSFISQSNLLKPIQPILNLRLLFPLSHCYLHPSDRPLTSSWIGTTWTPTAARTGLTAKGSKAVSALKRQQSLFSNGEARFLTDAI